MLACVYREKNLIYVENFLLNFVDANYATNKHFATNLIMSEYDH